MTLYDDVLNLSKIYLGPAAERFIVRQVSTHLQITSGELTAAHLNALAEWCFISGKLLMDEGKAREFSDKVRGLQKG